MIAFFAAGLVAAATPSTAPAGACAPERMRIVEEANFTFPEGARPTHERVMFLLDIGSDGRIRRTAKVESSGDTAVDAAAEKALSAFRFVAPSAGCVSASSVASQFWSMPAEGLASPPPAEPGTLPSPAACAPPFVRPARFPLPARREAPGTAAVDVTLDATARVTAVHLAQSSGNAKTDYAATVAARNGAYVFERQSGCAPKPTTYRLELTFH